jgi:hypothetical protein
MPLFKSVPRGFYLIHHTINTLSSSLLSILIHDIFTLQSGHLTNAATTSDMLYTLPIQYYIQLSQVSETTMNAILNSLLFIIRTIQNEHEKSIDVYECLTKETDLSPQVCELIANEWKTTLATTTHTASDIKSFLQLPFVSKFQWKIGVTLASSQKEYINTPFITLQFTTVDTTVENRPIREYTFRLKREEYNEFAQTFYEIENQMETM